MKRILLAATTLLLVMLYSLFADGTFIGTEPRQVNYVLFKEMTNPFAVSFVNLRYEDISEVTIDTGEDLRIIQYYLECRAKQESTNYTVSLHFDPFKFSTSEIGYQVKMVDISTNSQVGSVTTVSAYTTGGTLSFSRTMGPSETDNNLGTIVDYYYGLSFLFDQTELMSRPVGSYTSNVTVEVSGV